MFRLYHANDLELLKGILLKQMQQDPPSPFEREAILVQSQGMSHWLKLQLADGLGLAAQVEFPLPSNFVWQIFNHLQPDLPERSHFDKQICAWKLMRLLPQLALMPECAAIAHYLTNDEDGIKRYQLAQTIADVFDQYLVYRPDWLLSWELNVDAVEGANVELHPWQPVVWRALVADSVELGHSLDHRARLLEKLDQLVQQYPERLKALPKRLFVFGIAALPGTYWQVLQAISPVIDVHFFLLNPCRNFWGDIVSDRQRLAILKKQPEAASLIDRGNPLLASWGKLGRDFLTLINETADSRYIEDFELWYQDEQATSLLAHLQSDILNLHDRQQGAFTPEALTSSRFKQPIAVDDGSVRIISAHSPLREVQRLYDQILYWLDQDPDLKPRDIVVMVPDIDQYAPYIDAVFASHKAKTKDGRDYHIPWAIADQSMSAENPIIDGFLRLLNLSESRLLITEVQDWLDVPAIRNRFGLSADDLEDLRDWLARAQVRWGLDGEQRQRLGLPVFEQNSWRKGLRQLLLGYLLPDTDQPFMDDFPVLAVEGNEGEQLGKLMAFIDTLERWQQQLSQANLGVEQWLDLLQQLIPDFYEADEREQASLQYIRDAMHGWHTDLTSAAFTGSLTVAVVRSWFNEHLSQQGGWQRFLAGPVNFCTLMPMRSIPFKAVCMLGMNDSDYPRRVTPVGFDLMVSGKARRGDRSRREDDRYLFLEAITSAQRYLYISYRGHEVRENAELQPSVLLAELRDYLCDGFCLAGDEEKPHTDSRELFEHWLVEELPLQPYNQAHYVSDLSGRGQNEKSRFVPSYSQLWAAVANAGYLEPITTQQTLISELELPAELFETPVQWDDVISALTDPAKFFMRRRLKASLDSYWQEHETEEPFVPDNLALFQLKQQWLQRIEHEPSRLHNIDQESRQFTHSQQALGQLPVNALGQVWSEQVVADVTPLATAIVQLTQQPLEAQAFHYAYQDLTFVGELQNAYRDAVTNETFILCSRVGSNRGRHYLDAWLRLVFLTLVNPGVISHAKLMGINKVKGQNTLVCERLEAPTLETAQAQMAFIYQWFCASWQQPIAHYPDTLWQALPLVAEAQEISDAHEQASFVEQKMRAILDGDFQELQSPYVQRWLSEWVAELPEQALAWFEQYGGIMQTIANHLAVEGND